ncbi:MAG: hypothetical protein WCI18_15290 [Pseudomonadota bacterium]
MTPCLFESAALKLGPDPLLGLKLKGDLEKDLSILKCCHGSGCRMDQNRDVSRCDLEKRFSNSKALFDSYKSEYNSNLLPSLSSEQKEFIQKWLLSPQKGYMMSHPPSGPSPLWEIAAIASWQGGLKARVIRFLHFKDTDLYPLDGSCDILFVEAVDRLWLPEKALEFSLIIDFAFARAIPLWVSMVQNSKKPEGMGSSRAAQKYNRKLNELKLSRRPLEWIGESSLSKLQEQADGWQAFHTTP